jgi:hypothetical protein
MRALLFFCAATALVGCSDPAGRPEVVARVGGTTIDVRELRRSYLLHPQWQRGQTQMQTYLVQLEALVAQKLYAREAERLGLDRDSLLAGAIAFLREKETIKALYRKDVGGKVAVGEAEARRVYGWMKKRVSIDYVFTADSLRARGYAVALRDTAAGGPVLLGDSTAVRGRMEDVRIGGVARELEQAVFTAGLHEVRGPLAVPGGFMSFRVTGGSQEKFLSENDFQAQRPRVEKFLRNRKADSLAAVYVSALMSDKDLRLVPGVFWAVAEHFAQRVREAQVDPMKMQSVFVTSDEIRLLAVDLRTLAGEAIATHREGALTVGEFLRRLGDMPGSLRPRVRTPQNLKDAIGVVVRNQYLLARAEAEGRATDPETLYEFGLQRDEALAGAYFARRRSALPVTPAEIEEFRKRSPVAAEQVFFTLSMEALARDDKAERLLREELPALRERYGVSMDTARVRAAFHATDAPVQERPTRLYLREIFE